MRVFEYETLSRDKKERVRGGMQIHPGHLICSCLTSRTQKPVTQL